MSTLLLERSPAFDEGFERDTRRSAGWGTARGEADAHGRLTLDELITGVWEGLAVRGTVDMSGLCEPDGSRLSHGATTN